MNDFGEDPARKDQKFPPDWLIKTMILIFLLVLGSYLALSLSLVIAYGHYSFTAFLANGIGLFSLIFAIIYSSKEEKKDFIPSRFMIFGLVVGIVFSLILLIASPALIYSSFSPRILFLPFVLIESSLVFCLFRFQNNSKNLSLLFIFILVVWIVFSILVIQVSPHPKIDVWYQHQEATRTLLKGENPYQQIFSMPIQSEEYQVTYLYPYPPYTLLVTIPFYYLFGDIRYANLFCQLISVILLFKICKKIWKDHFITVLISALFLFNPRWPFVLEQAWTEPSFIVLLFGSVFLFLNSSYKLGAFFSGIFLAAKPYLLPLAFPFLKLSSPKKWSWILGFFSFIFVPFGFILWSPSNFYYNVVDYHLKSPFRSDSLSLTAFLMRNFSVSLPSWLSFVILLGTLLVGISKKLPYQYFLYAALAYTLFFWLSKQAFCNYYFFVESLLILTLALIPKKSGV